MNMKLLLNVARRSGNSAERRHDWIFEQMVRRSAESPLRSLERTVIKPKYFPRLVCCMTGLLAWLFSFQPLHAQTWATNSPLNVARWAHTATLLNDGTMLITGGLLSNTNGNSANTNACELYDPQTGTASFTASMQSSRDSHRATLLANGQVLVSGGGGDASSEVYDPNSGTWINYASMNDERLIHTATLLANGQVLAAGGYNDNSGQDLSSAELYDPVAGTWSVTASMTYPADTFAAVLLTNGTVLVCGGSDASDGIFYETNAAIYYPATQTWTNTAPMHEARAGLTATLLPNGKVLVVGGNGDNTAEVYDPVAKTWTFVSDLNDGWYQPNTVLLTNGQVMVLGDGNSDVEIYDPSADTWTYADSLPVAGNRQTATVLFGGQVVVTGGSVTEFNGPALATVQTYGTVTTTTTPSLTVTASPSSGLAPLNVQFTSPSMDSNGNTVTNWIWDFGDGGTSTAQNPYRTFTAGGSFYPSLTAYSTYGSTPLTVNGPGSITVSNLTLNVSVTPPYGLVPLTVQFFSPAMDSAGNTVTNWSWTFGDGGASTARSPTHIYTSTGSFTPGLTAYSSHGTSPLAITGLSSINTYSNPIPAFRTLYTFSTNFGSGPNPGLAISGNTLFGTTQSGGISGLGNVFALNTDGTGFTNLFNNFNSSFTNGFRPAAGVILSGSTLYGTTYGGGTLGGGTVFALGTNGVGFTNLVNFDLNVNPNSPDEPQAPVVLSGNTLYGTTWFGGSYDHGTVFSVATNGSASGILHAFYTPTYNPNANNYDGLFPSAKLIISGGTLYGTAENGGMNGGGTVFSVVTNQPGSFTVLHYFSSPLNVTNNDGANSFAGLVLSGTNLYGTTAGGGTHGYGVVFAVSTDGMFFTNLYNFTGGNDGSQPRGGLTLSGNRLYGTTSSGGAYTNGALFAINTDGSNFKSLYSFTGTGDGGNPQADLVLSGGTLYGTAEAGSVATDGTVFSFTLTGPPLAIALSGTNVILTWSGSATGYTLQSSLQIGAAAAWSNVSPLPVILNSLNTVTNPISDSQMFYRLSQ
jgi:uncharacterized repeat protein (TIGR03803 family)